MESRTSDVRAVLRLRTQAPHGLNETQADVIDRLQVLSENGTITELDVDVWGSTMGINQPAGLDPTGVQETVSEFEQWADEHDCTLQPAFERRNTGSMADEEGRRQETLVLPMLCWASTMESVWKRSIPTSTGRTPFRSTTESTRSNR